MTHEEILERLEQALPGNPAIHELQNTVIQIMELSDEMLTPTMVNTLISSLSVAIQDSLTPQMINNLKAELQSRGVTRGEVAQYLSHFESDIQQLINDLEPSTEQRELLNAIFDPLVAVFAVIKEQYHNYDFTLPMVLDEGAQIPTYAHETDAAADLYAADTITLPAHSISNMVRTGVHIQLPEGWIAMIFPRSSIGAKTGLRLSNSVGIIDNHYLGALGVLYDNISDSDYTINKGDRIAQLMVMPSYHFKPQTVEKLEETDRSSGGFGSTGK